MPPPGRLLALILDAPSAEVSSAAKASGIRATQVDNVGGFLEQLEEQRWTITLVSLAHPDMDENLASRIAREPDAGSLLLSAPGVTLERALLMDRIGAVGIVREPLDPSELQLRLEVLASEGPSVDFPPVPEGDKGAARLVGSSPALADCLETLARVARSTATVLITGESGTGKELVARSLHDASDRSKGPFVAINCAAIPEPLLESELFGHERGAFTGAVARKLGRFERAHEGTLFLDEIGDMSPALQAKLLRVLEEGTVERVGAEELIEIDVRVVAATNRELGSRRAGGAFREDLYHRLAVVELYLPPLRERRSDIRELALYFGSRYASKHARGVLAISAQALAKLERYSWPGNVRELRNVLDRAVLLASASTVRPGDLRLGPSAPHSSARFEAESIQGYPASLSLAEVEARHIETVLVHVDGHIGKAADRLGIHRNTLARKIRQFGLEVSDQGVDEP